MPAPIRPLLRACLVFALLLGTRALFALEHQSDWPCFQGPLGNGASPETGLLRVWPKDGPPLVWRARIGQGWGQPAIVGDAVYICWSADTQGNGEVAACLDAATGAERWRSSYDTPP